MPPKLRWDSAEVSKDFQVDETSEYLYVSPVTFAREGVFPYEDGRALKPGDELERAAQASRVYIAWDHPPTKMITQRREIIGEADSVQAVKDSKGVKVKGRLVFHKTRMSQDQQELIRSGARRDVSVGFYYIEDRTPGNWNGQAYDYVQREMLIDHVASVDHGRCSYPTCGIGVDQDSTPVRVAVDPTPLQDNPVMSEKEMNEEEEVSIEEDAQLTSKQKNRLQDSSFAYISPEGKRKLPIHDRRHVIAALNAIQNWSFRGQALDIPRSAKGRIKGKVCAAARKFGVKSAFCGTTDSAPELIRNLTAMDRPTLVGFHRFVHRCDDYVEDGPIHRAILYVLKKKR